MTCKTCGISLKSTDTVCPNCGEPVLTLTEVVPDAQSTRQESGTRTAVSTASRTGTAVGKKKHSQVICSSCGVVNDVARTNCENCGEPLANSMVTTDAGSPAQGARVSSGRIYAITTVVVLALTIVIKIVSTPESVMGPAQTAAPADDVHSGVDKNALPPGHPSVDAPPTQPPVSAEMTQELELARKEYAAKPNNDTATLRLANSLYDVAKHAEAVEYYQKYLKRHPDDVDARTDLAYSTYEAGDVDKAIKELNTVLKVHPRHQNAVFNMAMMFVVKKQKDSVLTYLRRVVEIDSTTQQAQKAAIALQQLEQGHQQ